MTGRDQNAGAQATPKIRIRGLRQLPDLLVG